MKSVITAVLITATTLGCTPASDSGYTPAPTSPPATAAPAVRPQSPTVDDVFIETIRDEYPEVVIAMGRQFLFEFARTACDAFDSGVTWAEIVLIAVEADVEPQMVGYLLGASVAAYCPWNMAVIG